MPNKYGEEDNRQSIRLQLRNVIALANRDECNDVEAAVEWVVDIRTIYHYDKDIVETCEIAFHVLTGEDLLK